MMEKNEEETISLNKNFTNEELISSSDGLQHDERRRSSLSNDFIKGTFTVSLFMVLLICFFYYAPTYNNQSSSMYNKNNINDQRIHSNKNFSYERPFILLTAPGCTGSSAVMEFLKRIMKEHGLESNDKIRGEFLKPLKNFIYQKQILQYSNDTGINEGEKVSASSSQNVNNIHNTIVQSINTLHQQFLKLKKKQYFIFKMSHPQEYDIYAKRLKTFDPVYIGLVRNNMLDMCVCEVRDCFRKNIGYPVFASNGTRTDMCFQRRKRPDVQVKAYFHPDKIQHGCITRKKIISKLLRNRKEVNFIAIEEKLFEFEYTNDEDTFLKCLSLWCKMLRQFLGDFVDEDIVSMVLKKSQNSRNMTLHDDVIQNLNQVIKIFKKNKLGSQLRLKDET